MTTYTSISDVEARIAKHNPNHKQTAGSVKSDFVVHWVTVQEYNSSLNFAIGRILPHANPAQLSVLIQASHLALEQEAFGSVPFVTRCAALDSKHLIFR